MSQRRHLTIYEPGKEPRVVELPITQSNTEENDLSVYNEDGTILKNYQLYLETADDQLIKVPCVNKKSKKKFNTLKFWKELTRTQRLSKSAVNNVPVSESRSSPSIIGDIPVSEKARNLLQTCMINSTKKENKIARKKDQRMAIIKKKTKNRRSKEKKKLKRLLRESTLNVNDCSSLATSIPRKCKSVVDYSVNDDSVIEAPTISTPVSKSSVQTKIVPSESNALTPQQCVKPGVENVSSSKAKRKRRRKKSKQMSPQNENETNKNNDTSESNRTSAAEPSPSLEKATCNPIISSQTVASDSSAVRWKASEPALDFIPVTRSDENKCDDYLSLNTRKNNNNNNNNCNRTYSKFLPNANRRLPRTEFVGLSQKAFFLQC